MTIVKTLGLLLLLIITLFAFNNICQHPQQPGTHHAVILVYHRFGEDRFPDTSVTMKQFRAQMKLLHDHYHVMSLPKIVHDLRVGMPLPKHTVAITIDDAYRSAYTNGWPVFHHYHFPFTLFVAVQPIDHKYPALMSWKMIKDLAKHGVTIGNHSSMHHHYPYYSSRYILKDTAFAEQRIKKETGVEAQFFAYPYGEYTLRTKGLAKKFGFKGAVAQYSGVVNANTDFYAIPRFAIDEHFGNLHRFSEVINSLPLHIKLISPKAIWIKKHNPPVIKLKLMQPKIDLTRLHCFAAHQGKIAVFQPGLGYLELLPKKLPIGRSRINCTYWAASYTWRWFGMPLMVLPPRPKLMHSNFEYDIRTLY